MKHDLIKLRERVFNVHKRLANDVMKTKPNWILDLKDHFKRKDAWPLSYMYYYQESKLHSVAMFNIILKKLGLKARFTNQAELVVFKARK
jgi:hypothetical protein